MTTSEFRFPATLNTATALDLRRQLDALPLADEYVFDFSALGHTDPFGMLFSAAIIKQFAARRRAVISGANFDKCGYQSHMGFFQALGIDHGNRAGEAPGGANYLPLTRLCVEDLREEVTGGTTHIGEVVARHAQRMAGLLTRSDEGDLYEVLAYSLQEMMRNIVEHSGAPAIEYCLQHWPTKSRVHLALLDTGVGMRASLSANPHLEISSDLDALKLALMPGVSGKMYKGKKRSPYDVWVNSGYGLYMTSRLSSEAGHFSVFSGSSSLTIGVGRMFDGNCAFDGTAVRISLDTRHIGQLSARLKQYTEEGREAAKAFDGADQRGPSLASRMLRAQFAPKQSDGG
jgi:hypothetical protein